MESTDSAPDATRAPDPAPRSAKRAALPRTPLSAERVARLRERISSGAYDAMGVAEEVARRLLASGEL